MRLPLFAFVAGSLILLPAASAAPRQQGSSFSGPGGLQSRSNVDNAITVIQAKGQNGINFCRTWLNTTIYPTTTVTVTKTVSVVIPTSTLVKTASTIITSTASAVTSTQTSVVVVEVTPTVYNTVVVPVPSTSTVATVTSFVTQTVVQDVTATATVTANANPTRRVTSDTRSIPSWLKGYSSDTVTQACQSFVGKKTYTRTHTTTATKTVSKGVKTVLTTATVSITPTQTAVASITSTQTDPAVTSIVSSTSSSLVPVTATDVETVVVTATETDTVTVTVTPTPSPQPPVTSTYVLAQSANTDIQAQSNGLSDTFTAPCTGTANATLIGGAGSPVLYPGWYSTGYTVTSAVVVGGNSTIPSGTVFTVQAGGCGHHSYQGDTGAGGWPNGGASHSGGGGGGSSELIVQATGERVVVAGGGGGNGASEANVPSWYYDYYGTDYKYYTQPSYNSQNFGQPEDDTKLMSSSTGGSAAQDVQDITGGGGGGLLGGQAGEDGNGGYAGSSKGDSIQPGSRAYSYGPPFDTSPKAGPFSGQVTITFTCAS